VVGKVIFSTPWDLLISNTNRDLIEILQQMIRLIGILHQMPLLYMNTWLARVCFPMLAKSISKLRDYTITAMDISRQQGGGGCGREMDLSVKDIFGQFSSVRDPATGELALGPMTIMHHSSGLIVAGVFPHIRSLFYFADNM
jgi:hypothetical protein